MSSVFDRLADAVDRAKAGHPLALVTVVVPGHASGRDILHHLARSRTVANTEVLTVPEVVTRLAATSLAPRQPLPYPLLEAAVQRVLAEAPGVFAQVADQPITARALAAAAWDLTGIATPGIETPTPLVANLLRVHGAATAGLAGRYYLQHEAYTAATGNLNRLGAVVVFAPTEHTAPAREFLTLLPNATRSSTARSVGPYWACSSWTVRSCPAQSFSPYLPVAPCTGLNATALRRRYMPT